jgi:hypothetical protein
MADDGHSYLGSAGGDGCEFGEALDLAAGTCADAHGDRVGPEPQRLVDAADDGLASQVEVHREGGGLHDEWDRGDVVRERGGRESLEHRDRIRARRGDAGIGRCDVS